MKNHYAGLLLVTVVCLLVSYNFLSAAWTAPAGVPPANNTDAPVNIGSTTQAKVGNLAANIFAATSEVRSNRYCDALGNNCVNLAAATSTAGCVVQNSTSPNDYVSCPARYYVSSINFEPATWTSVNDNHANPEILSILCCPVLVPAS